MRAVKVARKAVALGGRMQIMQMRGDLGRAKTGVIIGEPIVDTADDRLAIACEERGARGGGGIRRIGVTWCKPPDALLRIRRIEGPFEIFLGRHFIEGRGFASSAGEFDEALVVSSSRFAIADIGRYLLDWVEGADGIELGDSVV